MARYLFVYHGGSAPASEAEGKRLMAAWEGWLASMGSDLVDGGSPVGKSTTVTTDGRVVPDGGPNPTSGYSVIDAASLDEAIERAKCCPMLETGGSVELAETFEP